MSRPRPIRPDSAAQATGRPRLAGAWGSLRRDLTLREADGAPAGRILSQRVFDIGLRATRQPQAEAALAQGPDPALGGVARSAGASPRRGRTRYLLTMAVLAMAQLTMALLTMALLTSFGSTRHGCTHRGSTYHGSTHHGSTYHGASCRRSQRARRRKAS